MSALSDIVHVARPFTVPLGAKNNIGVQYIAEHAAQTMGSGESEVQYAYHRFTVTHSLMRLDTITLSEVRDILRMIHSIITKKRDLIVEGVISAAQRIINPPTKEEFWQEITDSWKAGRGTPDPLLAPEMPLEVYIRFDLFSPPTQGRGDFDFQFLLRETHEEVDPDKFLVDVRFELKAEMIDKTLPVVYYVQQLQSME